MMHALLGRGPMEEWRSRDVMGDCIGAESYIELAETHDGDFGGGGDGGGGGGRDDQRSGRGRYIKRRVMSTREHPPPLPCLVRTDDAHKCRTPWVMRRYYTGDGRLIIRQEKGDSHYLCAHRSNGRLTINLVPMPTQESVLDTTHKEEEFIKHDRVLEINEKENVEAVVVDGGGKGKAVAAGGSGGAGKCYKYETDVRSSRSCLYVMPVPAM